MLVDLLRWGHKRPRLLATVFRLFRWDHDTLHEWCDGWCPCDIDLDAVYAA